MATAHARNTPKPKPRSKLNVAQLHGSPACGYFNHEGCPRDTSCRYRHIPDAESIPDSRNKNVCYHFIMGTCKWTGGTCWYSHCLEYVAPSKKKVKALAKRRTAVGKDTDVEEVFQKLKTLNEKGEYESDGPFCIRRRGGSEVSDSFGFTSGDIELLMEQGIKPWEFEEASRALSILRYY